MSRRSKIRSVAPDGTRENGLAFKRVSERAELFGDEVRAVGILDRLMHDAEILTINGPSWRLRGRGELLNHHADSGERDAEQDD